MQETHSKIFLGVCLSQFHLLLTAELAEEYPLVDVFLLKNSKIWFPNLGYQMKQVLVAPEDLLSLLI